MNYDNNIKNNNIDVNEIKKINNLSDYWWDINHKWKSLHQINSLRLNYILQHTNGIFGKKILDIGCGGGILSESMFKEGAVVTGIDISYKLLTIAKLHALENNLQINYLQETVEEHLKNHIESYDIITCMEMLEHVPYPESIVFSCAKLLKLGGHVFFSTINRNIKSFLFVIFFAEYILKIIPKGIHDINKFIRPSELLSWVDKTTLKEQHIIGLKYNPIKQQFFLGNNVDTNYILHLIKKK